MNPVGKAVLWIGAFLVLWALVVVEKGRSHDAGGWTYPPYCCHNMDCAPVERQAEKDNVGVGTTKLHREITLDPSRYMHKMTSPDGKLHVCATPDSLALGGNRNYYCIFNPAGM